MKDELAEKLQAVAKARGMTLRELIPTLLEQAVAAPASPSTPSRYVLKTHDFGAHIEQPWTVFADLESQEYIRSFAKK
jgi:hypothetical protein